MIEVAKVSYRRPGGPMLLDDISFRVGDGQHVALIGANGVGKSTLLRLIAGDDRPLDGTIRVEGRLLVMRQLVASTVDTASVRDLLLSLAPPAVQAVAADLAEAEKQNRWAANEANGMRLAAAFARWGEVGGYETEVLWDAATTRAIGGGLEDAASRPLRTLSGGQQKRLALEVLLRSDADVLLLDEPDNFLDVPGKEWVADQINATAKTVLFVSHDRQLLADAAQRIVTVEGRGAWTHGASFESYQQARDDRVERLDDEHRRWQDERKRLHQLMREMKRRAAYNDSMASRAQAAETRLRHFDQAGPPPERPKDQDISVRLAGGRTGKRALTCSALSLEGLTDPFDAEILFGERIAVVGPNGTGKSHFLRLLAGGDVAHSGEYSLGARVVPGYFSQTHDHPEWRGRSVLSILEGFDLVRGPAMARLRRYELQECAEQWFETLSGGQQARLQILLLELGGANMLLLDEPTDNLDLASAEALEDALATFEGTVVAVTHDRWFLRSFDRFLVFGDDCRVAFRAS